MCRCLSWRTALPGCIMCTNRVEEHLSLAHNAPLALSTGFCWAEQGLQGLPPDLPCEEASRPEDPLLLPCLRDLLPEHFNRWTDPLQVQGYLKASLSDTLVTSSDFDPRAQASAYPSTSLVRAQREFCITLPPINLHHSTPLSWHDDNVKGQLVNMPPLMCPNLTAEMPSAGT